MSSSKVSAARGLSVTQAQPSYTALETAQLTGGALIWHEHWWRTVYNVGMSFQLQY
jgi:hypothetical protein